MIEHLLVHEIVIVRPTTTTGRGDDVVLDWTTSPTRTDTNGWVTQQGTRDTRPGQTGDIGEWHLTVDACTDIRPGDRVEWGDLTFDIDGRPLPAWTPAGHHHTECRLTLVEG